VEAREVLSGPQTFCALLWELRGPISMGGEMFWKNILFNTKFVNFAFKYRKLRKISENCRKFWKAILIC
jgi:hypothetical protein